MPRLVGTSAPCLSSAQTRRLTISRPPTFSMVRRPTSCLFRFHSAITTVPLFLFVHDLNSSRPSKKSRAKRRCTSGDDFPLDAVQNIVFDPIVAQNPELRVAVRGQDFVGSGHLRRVYSLFKYRPEIFTLRLLDYDFPDGGLFSPTAGGRFATWHRLASRDLLDFRQLSFNRTPRSNAEKRGLNVIESGGAGCGLCLGPDAVDFQSALHKFSAGCRR